MTGEVRSPVLLSRPMPHRFVLGSPSKRVVAFTKGVDPMDWTWGYLVLAALAGLVGGAVNSLAGGGTLITFPALTALGIPALQANVTNTMALIPGYLSGSIAQRAAILGRARVL